MQASKTVTGLLKRRRAWIIATVALSLAIADAIALLMPRTYEASAMLLVDQRVTSPSADLNATVATGQLLAAHYIKMATSATILDRVCSDLTGSCSEAWLKSRVTVGTVKGTDLLSISVADSNPDGPAVIANLLAAKLIAEQRDEVAAALKPTITYLDGELSRLQDQLNTAKPPLLNTVQAQYNTIYSRREAVAEQQSRLAGSLSLVEAASVPTAPAYSRTKLYLLAGLIAGLIAAMVIALLVDKIDSRIFAMETLADATAAPVVLTC